MRHGWLRHAIHDLEYNPHAQYRVHLVAVWFWLLNLPLCIAVFAISPDLWLHVGVFLTLLYSLYANAATDYDGMSSSLAAIKAGDAADRAGRD